MYKCLYCGEWFEKKHGTGGPTPQFCCVSHYQKQYYIEHREKKNNYCKERHKRIYIPHPIPPKYASEEERIEAKIKRAKQYYYDNREYYAQKSKEYAENHKNDPKRQQQIREAQKRYYERNREQILEKNKEWHRLNRKKSIPK